MFQKKLTKVKEREDKNMLVIRNKELLKTITDQEILMEEKEINGKVVYVPLEQINLESEGTMNADFTVKEIEGHKYLDSSKEIYFVESGIWIDVAYKRLEMELSAGLLLIHDIDEEDKIQVTHIEYNEYHAASDHLESEELLEKVYLKDVDSDGIMKRFACIEQRKFGEWIKIKIPGNIVFKVINNRVYLYDKENDKLYDEQQYPLT